MRKYFSYGSNMSRARLQERTGDVIHHGHGLLSGYAHRFDHKGQDGTAKGNIAAAEDGLVHGVVYTLSDAQVDLLRPYEGGYEIIHVELELVQLRERVTAYTYISEVSTLGLAPLDSYVEHYYRGMVENGIPEAYVEIIRRQANK